MRVDRNEREFYMGDSFNRGATMYFCSPEGDSLTHCHEDIAALNSSVTAANCNLSAQGTSSTSYGTLNKLTSSFDSVSSVTQDLSANMNRMMKSLQILGERLGVDINDIGNIEKNPKMNFKISGLNRLRRRELLTLKGNY